MPPVAQDSEMQAEAQGGKEVTSTSAATTVTCITRGHMVLMSLAESARDSESPPPHISAISPAA